MLNVEDLSFFLILHKLLSFLWGAHSVQGDFFVYLPGTFLRFGSCSTVLFVVF